MDSDFLKDVSFIKTKTITFSSEYDYLKDASVKTIITYTKNKWDKLKLDESFIEKQLESTRSIDEFCNDLVDNFLFPDHEKFAVILIVDQHYRNIRNLLEQYYNDLSDEFEFKEYFLSIMELLHEKDLINKEKYQNILDCREMLNNVEQIKDYDHSYLAINKLIKSYSLKLDGIPIETPQAIYLRTAFQIHDKPDDILKTYDHLSEKYIMHASPTLFNSCSNKPQLSSCFLIYLKDDSIEGICDTLKEFSLASKYGGGIGLCLSTLRSDQSIIHSSQNSCKGTEPVLKIYELMAKYVDQGGRRPGALCVYFEMSHPEIDKIIKFKQVRSVSITDNEHIKDIFFGLWVPDLFMKRVKENKIWSCFDKEEQETLVNLYGEEYEKKYIELEENEKYVKQFNALDLFNMICVSHAESTGPFICYKDTANNLSNQKNIGVIKSSNLCTEIFEVSSKTESAVCNLCSINLEKCFKTDYVNYTDGDGKYIEKEIKTVDYKLIGYLTKICVENLNKIIDKNYYCTESMKKSNLSSRPIGIGVTGLQGLFYHLELPFTSEDARKINKNIFETIYFFALTVSNHIAKEKSNSYFGKIKRLFNLYDYSGAYPNFYGSPLSYGKTHIDMYEEQTGRKIPLFIGNEKWDELKKSIMKYGVANSLLIALMPTVSTCEIVGAIECFEPAYGAIYQKNTLHGNYKVVLPQFRDLLIKKEKWTEEVIDSITKNNGSVQHLDFLTDKEKEIYKIVWEINPSDYISTFIDRAPFVDQSQSMSWFMPEPWKNTQKIGELHFFTWENKLKTGLYYMRGLHASKPIECQTCN